MTPVLAIVGRPNVGKSTLFNRLVGAREAIVHDAPGITRDRHYATTSAWEDREIIVVDTGGIEPRADDPLFQAMRRQAMAAVQEADVVLLVVDARAGLTPMDAEVARLLRESEKPVIVVANKVETSELGAIAQEFWSLGLSELFTISAEHGQGIADLMERVFQLVPELEADEDEEEEGEEDDESADEDVDFEEAAASGLDLAEMRGARKADEELRVAIVGRPNIGKSTLTNRLIGEDRHIVHDMPGTTMDAIDSVVVVRGQQVRFVDTAGIRRKSKVDEEFEGFAIGKAIKAIERCHVTLLVVDGAEGFTDQDARLANLVVERGRALLILVNKWDLVREDPDRNVRVVEDEFERRMPHCKWAPVIYISALTGKGTHIIIDRVNKVYENFQRRVTTADCNRFLMDAVANHSVPQRYRRAVRLNYMTQVRVRPPTFVIFSNTPEGVEESYERYLQNRLRESWDFEGSPIRIFFRKKRKPGEAKEDSEE